MIRLMSQYPVPADKLRLVDRQLLEALRGLASDGGASVGIEELVEALGVTATAVRQRIDRLLEGGLIDREKQVHGRGRPTYRYRLTVAGYRHCGADSTDIAEAMWREILAVPDQQVRSSLLSGIAARLGREFAAVLSERDDGKQSLNERLRHLSQLLADRHISAEVSDCDELPVLDICSCPYPSLTDTSADRAMCHLEEQMISTALGRKVQLSSCCLDGADRCQFTTVPIDEATCR